MSRDNTVKPLTDLFTIVIGLALTIALQGAIDATQTPPIKLAVIPALLAFLVTILPFTHGAITHVLSNYGESAKGGVNSSALLIEYAILFINGCLFIGWATLLSNTRYATYSFMTILAIDSLWGYLAWLFSSGKDYGTPSRTWATINAVTFIILFTMADLFIGSVYKPGWDLNICWYVAIIAVGRTGLDYALTWKFYIGRAARKTERPTDEGGHADVPEARDPN